MGKPTKVTLKSGETRGLGYVRPKLARDDPVNVGIAYAIFSRELGFSQAGLGCESVTDLPYLGFLQFGASVTFALAYLGMAMRVVGIPTRHALRMKASGMIVAKHVPFLRYLVRNVVEVCPEKEMIRANASPVVTTMQNTESFRDWADEVRVRESMRADLLSLDAELAISITVQRTSPFPARVGIGGLFKAVEEAFSRVAWYAGHVIVSLVDVGHSPGWDPSSAGAYSLPSLYQSSGG